jgi:hypothetical protein
MSKLKGQEYDFAKRTHISHVKSVICVFRPSENRAVPVQKAWKNPTRTPITLESRTPKGKLSHGYESYMEQLFNWTPTQLERAQRIRKGQPLPPQLDIKIS